MPETRVVEIVEDGKGNVIEKTTAEVSDEELAEDAERKVMEKAEELIDAIGNMSQAKIFLKRLVKRLRKNGALP